MKILVSIAALTIIAGTAYFVLNDMWDRQAAQQQSDRIKATADRLTCLENLNFYKETLVKHGQWEGLTLEERVKALQKISPKYDALINLIFTAYWEECGPI